ncbi:hypothetical protein C8Q76DRAFT_624131 [Earliella scabrosa]|nr:hypothetical protein C8Q76DRAFT_624131 [Earliella scabrosa]
MQLKNMPLDIFLEIASHLHPMDLLNMSRSSKRFRDILTTKHHRDVWTNSFELVEGLPPCPNDMSGPFYAALLFDTTCFACGAGRSRLVDYGTRTRLCKTCEGVK